MTLQEIWSAIGGIGGFVGIVGGVCGIVAIYQTHKANGLAARLLRLEQSRDDLSMGFTVSFDVNADEPKTNALCITVFNKSPVQTLAIRDYGLDNGLGPDSYLKKLKQNTIAETPDSMTIAPKRSKQLRFAVEVYVEDRFHFGSQTFPWIQFEHEEQLVEVPMEKKDEYHLRNFAVWVLSQRAYRDSLPQRKISQGKT